MNYWKKISNKASNYFARALLGRGVFFCAALLLAVMFVLTFFGFKDESITYDELAHISAGYSYLMRQDYRLNFEHPPLIKDLAAVPLLFLHLNFPKDSVGWANSNQWKFGQDFLFNSGNDPDRVLFWARLAMLPVLGFLGWFVFYWARKLGGNTVALLALAFFVFSPHFLAHGGLVTTDVGAALGAVLTIYFWIVFLKDASIKNSVVAGLIFGIALTIKFSLLILIPVLGIITIVYCWAKRFGIGQILRYIGQSILVGLIGIVFFVWPLYYFHLANYSAGQQMDFAENFFSREGFSSLEKVCLSMIQSPALRPLSQYCLGATAALERTVLYPSWLTYLNGQISPVGFWYYFPLLCLVKIPLAFHILTLIAGIGVLRPKRDCGDVSAGKNHRKFILKHFSEVSMIIFIFIYLLFALTSPLNIGIRHLLPIFPFIYILVAMGLAAGLDGIKTLKSRKVTIVAIVALLVWYVISSLSVFPYYLTYYNELAGGAQNGYKVAVDSNYDWGQDLKRLSQWVEKEKIDKIYVDYFGYAEPEYYLKNKYYPWRGSSWWSRFGLQSRGKLPAGNYLAVSATFLQQGRGVAVPGFEWPAGEYNWLNDYRPVAHIGNSIFIYYIN